MEGNLGPEHLRLKKLFKRLYAQFPGKTEASVYFDACERKADAAILLEQLISWSEAGDDWVCNWTMHRCKWDKDKVNYMFLTPNDIKDIWGDSRPDRTLNWLKSKKFIATQSAYSHGKQGRLLRVKYKNVYAACNVVVKNLLDTKPPDAPVKSLLVRARSHVGQPFEMFTFQDVMQGTLQRANKYNRDKFLRETTAFNKGALTQKEYRAHLFEMDLETQNEPSGNYEPTRISWVIPRAVSKREHAGHRLREIASIFAFDKNQMWEGTPMLGGLEGTEDIEKKIVMEGLDLNHLLFIAVSYMLNPLIREGLGVESLREIALQKLGDCFLYCLAALREGEGFNLEPFHPNSLVINELITLGFLEKLVVFKNYFGDQVLQRLMINNALWGETTLLQRLCIYGKVFPGELHKIKAYSTETDKYKRVPNALKTLNTLEEEQRKTLRAMYPSVFHHLELEAHAYT